MIPQETVNLILDTARVEDIVGDFVSLKRAGASYKACCPFHDEKTPSFVVTPAKGIYKCFGCGKAGGPVQFLMDHEQYTYVEALRYIAKRYHIDIQEEEASPEEILQKQHMESLHVVMDFAQKFYTDQMDTPEGKAVAMTYYSNRGLTPESVRKFGLGWAPNGRTKLMDAALAAGFKMEILQEAGLVKVAEDGTVSDKFKGRVTFPIHTVSGRVVAYSCRTLSADVSPKYINSADTPLYSKTRSLLGLYYAKAAIAKHDKCYLVEGNLDVITLQQLGIENVVASCGTSLTVEQIRLIHRFTSNLTIMYDGDKAGIKAALRGIDMALAEGMNLKVVFLPDGEDPDSYGRKHSLAEFKAFLDSGEKDFIEFKCDLLLEEAAGDPVKKAALINDVADSISRIPDEVTRTVYVQGTAEKFGIEQDILVRRILDTRRKALEDSRKDTSPVAREEASQPLQPQVVLNNRTLAPYERDILHFLIRHGCSPLVFPTDSPYYEPDVRRTVCEFIRGAMGSDTLVNEPYRAAFEEYVALYDARTPEDQILRKMLDSPDRTVALVVQDVAMEKYQLTLERLKASLTTTDSWLVASLPKVILSWQAARVQDWIDADLRRMVEPEADQLALMQDIMKFQKLQKQIKEKLEK